MFKIFIFITLFFIHCSLAKTLETNLNAYYETNPYISYTLAKELNETVDQLENRIWTENKKNFNTLQYANNAYWARINIKNITNTQTTYYLKAENQFTYKIDYYLVENKKIISHIADGVTSKNSNRDFNANHMLFPLTLHANAEVSVYFKIRNYNKININFSLVSKEYLIDYYQTYNMVEGIFFGGMLVMMFYNLFLYVLFRIQAYLYYVGYVFWVNVYFIGLFGFSQRYFESQTYLFYLSTVAFFVFLTLFVQSILKLKTKLPTIHKILNFFIFYFILSTLLNAYALEVERFLYAQLLFNIFFMMLFMFATTIIGVTYYLAYTKNDAIAKFYSVIWTLLALMGMFLPFQYLNIISIDIPADYIFQFLTLIEVLFFSFILAYNINLIEKEKKEQEKLFVQQNKLASMGEVVAMIAHQWRQPLSEINGVILNMDIDHQKKQLSNNKFNAYLDSMENTTLYMSQTINDFLNYFKHNKQAEEFEVTELIQRALTLVSSTNKAQIRISYQQHPSIKIFSYQSELIQALLIVINNAIDACLCRKPLHTALIKIHVKQINQHVLISIEDNGNGIPAEIMDKIYDPYFTTKHKAKGTGLGLYILKMIIEQHIEGKIEISSQTNITTCNLLIPERVSEVKIT
ncbi:MAG: Signal Transduction Histidine Kinase (STHK) with CheB and CheR activity [uncultured Sulfurovum sp.]|uniref:histidine kinase n=1 Tax=uncultured Sulfurovum sp. TaxID=269237 RepID=A0A6S6TZX7_9BACT|nr:MAG: Signal Transduction Histidine Kinase (STHK) with CheB and CheR activity [uncultured Sulfurovum sp.]